MKGLLKFSWACIATLILSGSAWPQKLASSTATNNATSPYPADDLHTGPAWFVDAAKSAGLNMQNVNGGIDTKK